MPHSEENCYNHTMSKNKEASKREQIKLAGQMDYLMIAGLVVSANIVSDAEMLNQYIKL